MSDKYGLFIFVVGLCLNGMMGNQSDREVNFESMTVFPDIDTQNKLKVKNAFVKKLNRSSYGLTFELDALVDFDSHVTVRN